MNHLARAFVTTTVLSFLVACNGNSNTQQTPAATASIPASPVAATPAASAPTTAPSPTGVTKVDVVAKDMAFTVSSNTAPAGTIEFVTQNKGPSEHELVVLKTDLAPNQLPYKGNKVDEDASGIKVIDEIDEDDLKVGTTQTLRANLTPGKYLLLCNLPGHAKAGMVTPFTVQ